MKKILFEGYYGQRNTGDDAFIEVSAWGAQKYWNTERNFFLSENLPITQTKTNHLKIQKFRGQSRFETLFHLSTADALISSGGSTFEGIFPKFHVRNFASLKKIFIKSFKIGAIGISLGPFKNTANEKYLIEYLRKLDFLSLRDEYSYKLAMNYNLPYLPINAFDLAALLPEIYKNSLTINPPTNEKVIGISICNYERYKDGYDLNNETRRTEYIKNLILEVRKNTNTKLRFFEFNGNKNVGDKAITNSIIEFLTTNNIHNIEFIPYQDNVYCTYKNIAECDLVISSRLHASIFACFANVPFFLIEYHRKCVDFLNTVGYNEEYRVFDGLKKIDQTVTQILNILDCKNNYISPTKIQDCKDKALKNFTSVII